MFVVMLFDRDPERMNLTTYKTLLVMIVFQLFVLLLFPCVPTESFFKFYFVGLPLPNMVTY